jgi:hypothetical protein
MMGVGIRGSSEQAEFNHDERGGIPIQDRSEISL